MNTNAIHPNAGDFVFETIYIDPCLPCRPCEPWEPICDRFGCQVLHEPVIEPLPDVIFETL